MSLNISTAKRILSSSQIQNLLRTTNNQKILLNKAFEYIGKHQSQIGYEVVSIRADVPVTPNKGEVELAIQIGIRGNPKSNKMFEITYSRKLKKFNIDEELPNLF